MTVTSLSPGIVDVWVRDVRNCAKRVNEGDFHGSVLLTFDFEADATFAISKQKIVSC